MNKKLFYRAMRMKNGAVQYERIHGHNISLHQGLDTFWYREINTSGGIYYIVEGRSGMALKSSHALYVAKRKVIDVIEEIGIEKIMELVDHKIAQNGIGESPRYRGES